MRCFLMEDVFLGSCNFADVCNNFISAIDPTLCPESWVNAGIDCSCPLKIPAGTIDFDDSLLVYDYSQNKYLNFLAVGDFDIKVVMNDHVGYIGCLNVKFTVKKASSLG